MRQLVRDFKAFAVRGNAIDLAVGVIIGAAFGKIVSSLVSDVIMPSIGLLLGKVDFSTLSLTIGASTIAYGKFIQSVVDFLIVAFCIFITIQQLQRFKKKEEKTPSVEPPEEVKLLTEIRDLLKK